MAALLSGSICRKCGAPLPRGGSAGFCARCLFSTVARPLSTPAAEKKGASEPQRLGEYDLLEQIAQGGMGIVYRARDRRANRVVALKMILEGRFSGEWGRKRFRTEAEAVASLDHPNIVPVYEVGEADGRAYFTMKFVDGINLSRRLASGAIEPRAAATMMAKVARALHHAHERGILHRDLKPANILLDAQEEPFVTDFGLARRLSEESDLTQSGVLMGTPNYMSPEQASGKIREVTTASDVYGLGAMLFHMLTGAPPFASESPQQTVRLVLEQEPKRISAVFPRVDRDLETICLKCLEKAPGQRYSSALEFALDLERWLGNRTILARRSTAPERVVKWAQRRPVVAALLGAVVLTFFTGVAGVFFQWRKTEAARISAVHLGTLEAKARREAEAAYRSTTELLSQVELEKADGLLASGNSGGGLAYLARVLRRDPANAVASARIVSYLSRRTIAVPELVVAGGEARVITTALTADHSRAAFSLGQVSENVLAVDLQAPENHAARVTHPIELRAGGRTAPGGGGFGMGGPPLRARGPMGPQAAAAGLPPGLMSRPPLSVALSIDGKKILTTTTLGEIRVWDATTGAALLGPVTPDLRLAESQFSSDGQGVLVLGRDGTLWKYDIETGKEKVLFRTSAGVAMAKFSPNKDKLLAAGIRAGFGIWDVNSGKELMTLERFGQVQMMDWSSDGESIAFAVGSNLVTVARIGAGAGRQKILLPGTATALALSFDGKLVLAGAGMTAAIWNTATGERVSPEWKHPDTVMAGAISRDGALAVTIGQDTSARVWAVGTERALVERLTEQSAAMEAHFTEDNRGLIVVCRDGAIWKYTLALPASSMRSIAAQSSPKVTKFSPNGKFLLTAAEKNAQVLKISSAKIVATLSPGAEIIDASWSPDGSKILTAGENLEVRVWDAATGQAEEKTMSQSSGVLAARFSSDGKLVEVTTRRGLGEVWDWRTGAKLSTNENSNIFERAILSPDGAAMLAMMQRGAMLFDFRSGAQLSSLLRHADMVGVCNFSADGRKIITASADNTARIWDGRTGEPLSGPLRHDAAVNLGVFSPNGKLAATCSQDKTVRLWNTTNSASLAHTLNHDAAVRYAEFSADGSRLLTVADDFSVHLWDTALGQELVDAAPHASKVLHARLSPDNQTIFIATADGKSELWVVPQLPTPAPLWLADLAEMIGGQRIDARGLTQPAPRHELPQLRQTLRASSSNDLFAQLALHILGEK